MFVTLLVNPSKEDACKVSFYSMLKWASGSKGADSVVPASPSLTRVWRKRPLVWLFEWFPVCLKKSTVSFVCECMKSRNTMDGSGVNEISESLCVCECERVCLWPHVLPFCCLFLWPRHSSPGHVTQFKTTYYTIWRDGNLFFFFSHWSI